MEPNAQKIIRRPLMCELTPEEKVRIADQAFAKQTEIDGVKAKKSAAVAEANEELKALRAVHERLSKAYMAGVEERDVDCIERARGDGTIEMVRLDTGHVLDDKQRGKGEQTSIFDAVKEPKKGGKKGKAKAAKTASDEMSDDEMMMGHADRSAPPIARPGKACDGCSMADGTHHPECTVAHPEKEPSDEPITDVASRAFRGVAKNKDGSDRVFELTTRQVADVQAGKAVTITLFGESWDVVLLQAIPADEIEGDVPDYSEAAKVAEHLETEAGMLEAIAKFVTKDDADYFHANSMKGAAWKAMAPAPRSRIKAAFRAAVAGIKGASVGVEA